MCQSVYSLHLKHLADPCGNTKCTDVISSNDVVLGHPQKRIIPPDSVGWRAKYTVDRVCLYCMCACECCVPARVRLVAEKKRGRVTEELGKGEKGTKTRQQNIIRKNETEMETITDSEPNGWILANFKLLFLNLLSFMSFVCTSKGYKNFEKIQNTLSNYQCFETEINWVFPPSEKID